MEREKEIEKTIKQIKDIDWLIQNANYTSGEQDKAFKTIAFNLAEKYLKLLQEESK